MNAMASIPATLQVEERALRQCVADLPDPAEYARYVPAVVVEALARVEPGRHGLRARDNDDARTLRRWGLCDSAWRESDGRNLTNFGSAVRRELIEWLDRLWPPSRALILSPVTNSTS